MKARQMMSTPSRPPRIEVQRPSVSEARLEQFYRQRILLWTGLVIVGVFSVGAFFLSMSALSPTPAGAAPPAGGDLPSDVGGVPAAEFARHAAAMQDQVEELQAEIASLRGELNATRIQAENPRVLDVEAVRITDGKG